MSETCKVCSNFLTEKDLLEGNIIQPYSSFHEYVCTIHNIDINDPDDERRLNEVLKDYTHRNNPTYKICVSCS